MKIRARREGDFFFHLHVFVEPFGALLGLVPEEGIEQKSQGRRHYFRAFSYSRNTNSIPFTLEDIVNLLYVELTKYL